jgi:hypothetical protein
MIVRGERLSIFMMVTAPLRADMPTRSSKLCRPLHKGRKDLPFWENFSWLRFAFQESGLCCVRLFQTDIFMLAAVSL